ncbi:MAG: RagB/SusD family nutrient uptake outer membrane protein, partial [Candidatus Nephrothrix sp. EaCA]
MQKGDKPKAASEFRAVIAAKLYSLLPRYADLWNAGNYNHSESIYEISFGQANNTGNNFV